jgi:serine/threonine protein kinase/Ca2+-binding EF-hand superfamily protein
MGNLFALPSVSSAKMDCPSQMFASFDLKHQGTLTLRELMSASAPGLVMPHSLPALYFFDDAKDGRITREEFTALVSFCQQEKKNVLDTICHDRALREIITRASAAGVKDCSAPGRTSFRRFSSYANVRSVFSRRDNPPDVPPVSHDDVPSPLQLSRSPSASSSHHRPPAYPQFPRNALSTDGYPCPGGDEHGQEHRTYSAGPASEPDFSDTDLCDEDSGRLPQGDAYKSDDVARDWEPPEGTLPGYGVDAADLHNLATTASGLSSSSSDDMSNEKLGNPDERRMGAEEFGLDDLAPLKNRTETAHDDSDSDETDSSDDDDSESDPNAMGAAVSRRLDAGAATCTVVETFEPLDAEFCTSIDAAVIERIAKLNIHKLADTLHREGSRKLFMQWLWKLVDFDSNGMITLEELRVFLEALGEDGIDLQELAFYKEAGVPLEECIMNEFDTTHTGVLDEDEFMVLADLVTREYEFWESRHLDRIGDYELGRTIGRGSSCVVRMGVHVQTHDRFAIKIIRKGKCADMGFIDREIQALKIVKHSHIVELEEVLESDENIFLAIELCGGGSLSDVLRLYPDERMPEGIARYYLRQVFEATAFCHQNGICHRDVRLDNVLLDNKGVVKITDFGHSKMYTPGWDFHSTMLVGSIHNLSPEQIAGQVYSGEKIDIWSTGVAMFTLLVGHPPFFDQDTAALLRNISTGSFEIPSFVSDEAADLIRCMIRVLPSERVPLSQLLVHPWFYTGNSRGPSMDVYSIPVDMFYCQRPDLAEIIMACTIHEHNLHFHLADALNPKSSPEDLRGQDWSLKCLSPQMDIKFAVSLFTKNPTTPGLPGSRSDATSRKLEMPNRPLATSKSTVDGMSECVGIISEPGQLSRAEKSFPAEMNKNTWDQMAIGHGSGQSEPRQFFDDRRRMTSNGATNGGHGHKRSKSLNGEDKLELQALGSNIQPVDSSPQRFADPGEFDAFPHQKVFPRKKMPEATRLFDSNRRIAAAAEAAKKLPGAPGRNLQRSFTFDNAAALSGKGKAERAQNCTENWSIARTLAQHPSKAHISPVARQVASGFSVQPTSGSDAITAYEQDCTQCIIGPEYGPVDYSPVDGSATFQPYIEVRLQSGETGLFLRICHKLKSICDTKLAAAAASQKQRSSGRRTASASISAFRRIASVRSIERR